MSCPIIHKVVGVNSRSSSDDNNSNDHNNDDVKSNSSSNSSSFGDTSKLCPTGQMIVQVLMGASERALLLDNSGYVLFGNEAARHFLYHHNLVQEDDDSPSKQKCHVSDFCIVSSSAASSDSSSGINGNNNNDITNSNNDDWKSLKHSFIRMKDGTVTRTQRNIKIQSLDVNEFCTQKYYTMYVCSKHERVRQVVDNAFDPVFSMDCSGNICTANDSACVLFGYTETELIGSNISIICGGGHAENHNTYLEKYLKSGKSKILGKKRQVLGKKKDGTEFPCEIAVQEFTDVNSGIRYFCGFVKDLTILLQHEQELQQRQVLFQGMINASFDPMVEIDEMGIIQIVNDAACNMFGYSKEEFIGSNISMICGDGHASQHSKYLKRYLETGERHIIGRKRQVKARRKDGSEFYVELGVQEVPLLNDKRSFCGYIRDLTQQYKDKRALRKQQQLIHGKFFGTTTTTENDNNNNNNVGGDDDNGDNGSSNQKEDDVTSEKSTTS